MQKLAALFHDSYLEFKKTRTITTASMFAAIAVVLGSMSLEIGNYIRIGFSSIANQFVYYLFGPVVGGCFGGALDVLKYFIKPTGEFFPGWTFNAALAGVIYGCFFYKKKLSYWRILAGELTVAVICNMFLGTLWLSMMYGKAFMVLFPARAIKNLVMCPVSSLIFYTLVWSLERSGILRMIRQAK